MYSTKRKLPGQTLFDIDIGQTFTTLERDNVAASIDDDEWRPPSLPVAGDKLHRRNPIAVRQEIQSYDNLIPETLFVDVELNEMPGLQNTDQWKRIAARTAQVSPPISRHVLLQQAANGLNSFDETVSDALQPRNCNYNLTRSSTISLTFEKSHRRLVLGAFLLMCVVASAITVVTAVILVRKTETKPIYWYPGSIYVRARFDTELLTLTSTLAKNYQREFCSLVQTILDDMKTKYAVFYSDCTVTKFRNGSIIGDFQIGFSRYQNVTRLNSFLNRTLVYRQLFGGTIQTINFNLTTATPTGPSPPSPPTTTNSSDNNDYSEDYDDKFGGVTNVFSFVPLDSQIKN